MSPWGTPLDVLEGMPASPEDEPDNPRTLEFDRGALDFASSKARNRSKSVLLCLAMGLVAGATGYALGWSVEALFQSKAPAAALVPFSIWGAVGAVAMAVGTAMVIHWALQDGDNAILAMNAAVPADPVAETRLYRVVEEIAFAAGAPTPSVFVIETPERNAFATGMRPDKAGITVTRGLLHTLNREELQAAVAREFGCIISGDAAYKVLVALVAGFFAFLSDQDRSGAARAMPARLLLALLSPLATLLVWLAVSPRREHIADAVAARMTRNPTALASALTKIAAQPRLAQARRSTAHLYIVNPLKARDDPSNALFSTHPPTAKRVERLKNLK